LVIGRKNWLFSQSFEGAQSSAIILSLIETAKRNNLDPEKYIEYLFDQLPNEENSDRQRDAVGLFAMGKRSSRTV
jgi:hypothetical protein